MYMVFDDQENPDPGKQFFCDLSADARWRRTSGTSGNSGKHVQNLHRKLFEPENDASAQMSKPELTKKNLLALMIEQDLPFTFADSPRLHGLLWTKGDRRTLSPNAERMVTLVWNQIQPRIKCGASWSSYSTSDRTAGGCPIWG
jgi:hypothetical protein